MLVSQALRFLAFKPLLESTRNITHGQQMALTKLNSVLVSSALNINLDYLFLTIAKQAHLCSPPTSGLIDMMVSKHLSNLTVLPKVISLPSSFSSMSLT